MYEALISHLRECAKLDPNENTFNEAADAIEELSRKIESLESMREITPEAKYAIDKHADNIISHMDELIRDLENEPRWIPVTERLPEAGERVLCYCRANIYEVMKMRTDGDWVYDTNHVYMHSFVTHWMPLPEPPKEERA